MLACDIIVDADILNGGPFRAVAQTRKNLKGEAPKIFEIEGYNSYNWDTVHQGLSSGSRYILFLSKTDRADVLSTLTPAAPRLNVTTDGVLLELGDPPFRIPVKPKALEEGIALILEQSANNKTPERAEAFIRQLWDDTEIESRYLAVTLTGALRDRRLTQLLADASRDKILKMRLTAIEALGNVGSPEAINALCILLKDDKPTVSREAARALVNLRRADTLPELLEWARRIAGAKGPIIGANGKIDPNKQKAEAVALEIVKLAIECGPLLEPEAISRPLFEIVRSGNDTLTRAAFVAIAEIARAPQIALLIELAEDRTYDQRNAAVDALQKITLKTYKEANAFRSWWSESGQGFNDELIRDLANATAAGLANKEKNSLDDRRDMRELLRKVPPDIALEAIAPLVFSPDTESEFDANDVTNWFSPLAAPLLVERLGRGTLSDRRAAITGLTLLCFRHPRLRETLWPLLRAELADEDSSCRRLAHAAVGALAKTDGIPALLDSIQVQYQYTRSETYEGYHALYNCSARTMGFATNEPGPDQIAAQQRFRGWWESAKGSFAAKSFNAARLSDIQWPDGEPAARAAKLEAMTLGNASRASTAAFAVLLAERPINDPFWAKLLSQSSVRDHARGLVASYGGNGNALAESEKRLSEDSKDGALGRALALTGLATVRGPNGTAPGAEKIVEWLKGPGAKADAGWKRLAVLSLGLCDGNSASLAYLNDLLDQALPRLDPKAKDAKDAKDAKGKDAKDDQDIVKGPFDDDKPADEPVPLRPIVIALCARNDGSAGLLRVLKDSKSLDLRTFVARELSLRRSSQAVDPILKAMEATDRYTWSDWGRIAAPLLKPSDVKAVCELFDSENAWARADAAFLLAVRSDLGSDEAAKALIAALGDHQATVRYYAVDALGKRKVAGALRALVQALEDDDSLVRGAAADAIGKIGDKLACRSVIVAATREFRFSGPPTQEWYTALAIAGGEEFFQQFLKLCNSNMYSDQQQGLDAMAAVSNPKALDLLLKFYRDDETQMQTQAFDVLARRGGSVVDALQADLKSTDKNARARAIHLLSHIDARASRELLTRVSNDANEDAALRALADFGLQRLKK